MAFSTNGGGYRSGRRSRNAIADINVTPFVDVVLVLLIIFMLTAHVMEFGIEVDVPKVRTVKETAQEMFEAAGFEIMHVSDRVLTEGWSIHELGTVRMGNDPKTSVLNQFEQSHDVRNLFVVDGSAFVNASCQNPTWTIMSLCWRSCDYLVDEMKKGNL